MFSRGLSAAIPTVCMPFKGCFRRNHHRIYSSFPCRILMIPVGNIMPGDTCPWVSLRSTHGYKSDHPRRGCRHIRHQCRRNAGELPLAPTLPVWTIINDALEIMSIPIMCLHGQSLMMHCKSPRSCRGDWKVARNTCTAETRSIPSGDAPNMHPHKRAQRGRASTRPYTACMDSH